MTSLRATDIRGQGPEIDPAALAAIVVAVDQVWTRPAGVAPPREDGTSWRFSGRWWAKPDVLRRQRPHR